MKTVSADGKLLLRCGRVVTPDRVLENVFVVIEAGRIRSISSSAEAESQQVLDLQDTTLFPGFIDLHIHGAVGVDTMSSGKEDLQRVSQFLATKGVTAWLPTLVPASASDYQKAIDAIEGCMNEGPQGARVLGVHYEGPFVNSAQCGALHAEHFRSFATGADLDALPIPRAGVRMMTLAPEVDGGIDLTRELVGRGWVVSLGHTRAGLDQLDSALAAGAHHMTHLMNAMPPFHHRTPGPVAWGLTKDDVTFDVIADGVHVDPLVLRVLLKSKGTESMMLISDAIAAAGKGDGNYEIWGETISVKEGRTSNSKGSIAGSVSTMLDAVRMMRSLGVSDVELARMVASNPSRLLGVEREFGSIEVGKHADLIALDERGEVRCTFVGGRLMRSD